MRDDFFSMKPDSWAAIVAAMPDGFSLPDSYRSLVERGTPDIAPMLWFRDREGMTEEWIELLAEQYPARRLIPFAGSTLNDDVFCWDLAERLDDPTVHLIHSFSDPGWEERGHWLDFDEWLSDVLDVHERWVRAEGDRDPDA